MPAVEMPDATGSEVQNDVPRRVLRQAAKVLSGHSPHSQVHSQQETSRADAEASQIEIKIKRRRDDKAPVVVGVFLRSPS